MLLWWWSAFVPMLLPLHGHGVHWRVWCLARYFPLRSDRLHRVSMLQKHYTHTMASTKSPSTSVSTATLMVVLMLVICEANLVAGSHFTVWSGPGCSNQATTHSNCGCNFIRYHGGYRFEYTGQTAALYNQPNCQGVAHTRLNNNAEGCHSFGWKSIFIQC